VIVLGLLQVGRAHVEERAELVLGEIVDRAAQVHVALDVQGDLVFQELAPLVLERQGRVDRRGDGQGELGLDELSLLVRERALG
jgi:hypothetical protein